MGRRNGGINSKLISLSIVQWNYRSIAAEADVAKILRLYQEAGTGADIAFTIDEARVQMGKFETYPNYKSSSRLWTVADEAPKLLFAPRSLSDLRCA
jgi:hypothetical protein